MVDENELRAHLTSGEPPAIAIDTAAVISRSKSRRRPRQWAVGVVGALAVSSLIFTGANVIPLFSSSDTAVSMLADDSAPESAADSADTGAAQAAPDDSRVVGLCGATIPVESASPFGLTLELELPAEVVASGSAFGTVRLTNDSDAPVQGTTASVPDVNLLDDSIVISHSPDAQILSVMPVNLQPGQSIEFSVAIAIYDCTTIDTGGMVDPGTYAVSSTLAFVPTDPADGAAAEVRSEQMPIVLQ
ncbi:hypothetical protein I6E81_13915 [Salinibacterium sp. NG22]|uniref:hypothetical protein n=1 Tax=Salinibacterium sp. NG22 TaxID=2792040 RepID=UPI0018CCEA73|nr:hypothetical protein [Salinibacterium sp. NG22]MBH0111268.1 hypothetical protein [Salinibacterium sp. NG22]